jgi:hypothetical protein
MGWAPRQVVIVDEDLGRSGAESSAREGFQHLVADVGLGKVGISSGSRCPVWPGTTLTGISCWICAP